MTFGAVVNLPLGCTKILAIIAVGVRPGGRATKILAGGGELPEGVVAVARHSVGRGSRLNTDRSQGDLACHRFYSG